MQMNSFFMVTAICLAGMLFALVKTAMDHRVEAKRSDRRICKRCQATSPGVARFCSRCGKQFS